MVKPARHPLDQHCAELVCLAVLVVLVLGIIPIVNPPPRSVIAVPSSVKVGDSDVGLFVSLI